MSCGLDRLPCRAYATPPQMIFTAQATEALVDLGTGGQALGWQQVQHPRKCRVVQSFHDPQWVADGGRSRSRSERWEKGGVHKVYRPLYLLPELCAKPRKMQFASPTVAVAMQLEAVSRQALRGLHGRLPGAHLDRWLSAGAAAAKHATRAQSIARATKGQAPAAGHDQQRQPSGGAGRGSRGVPNPGDVLELECSDLAFGGEVHAIIVPAHGGKA